MREKPSSKAREVSYSHCGKLFRLLDYLLGTEFFWTDGDGNDTNYLGWKEWVNKYTPADKRGGPANPKGKRR